jgi:hypothetical protein
MQKQNNSSERKSGRHENLLPKEISNKEKEQAVAAHDEAEKDINDDPEFAEPGPNDDLDEGETARLGEDNTDLV